MTIKEIVKKYLIDNGYDGLTSNDNTCMCTIDDLFDEIEPIKCIQNNCSAGHEKLCVRCRKRCKCEFYAYHCITTEMGKRK